MVNQQHRLAYGPALNTRILESAERFDTGERLRVVDHLSDCESCRRDLANRIQITRPEEEPDERDALDEIEIRLRRSPLSLGAKVHPPSAMGHGAWTRTVVSIISIAERFVLSCLARVWSSDVDRRNM